MEEHIEFSDEILSSYINQTLLAGQISSLNDLVKKVKCLTEENNTIKEKMKNLKESAKQVKKLYEEQLRKNHIVSRALFERNTQVNNLRQKNLELEHSQINSQLTYTQLLAEMETKACCCTLFNFDALKESLSSIKNLDSISFEKCIKLCFAFLDSEQNSSNEKEVQKCITNKDLQINPKLEFKNHSKDISNSTAESLSLESEKETLKRFDKSTITEKVSYNDKSICTESDSIEKTAVDVRVRYILQEMVRDIPNPLSPPSEEINLENDMTNSHIYLLKGMYSAGRMNTYYT